MLVFADASEAVRCGLAIRERFALEPRSLPLRLGAHFGPVMFREGDYVGIAVTTAARVTAAASRHQFLVTGSVRERLAGLEVEVLAVGERSLKGLTDAVELFELRGAGTRAIELREEGQVGKQCGYAEILGLSGAKAARRAIRAGQKQPFLRCGARRGLAGEPSG